MTAIKQSALSALLIVTPGLAMLASTSAVVDASGAAAAIPGGYSILIGQGGTLVVLALGCRWLVGAYTRKDDALVAAQKEHVRLLETVVRENTAAMHRIADALAKMGEKP